MGTAKNDGIVPAHPTTDDIKNESVDMNLFIDPVKERKMMWEFDFCASSMLGLFYMMANLDQGNLGNAQIAGMNTEIGLKSNQYGNAVTLLYSTYVTIEAPSAILLKVIGPQYVLAGCSFYWGVTNLGMSFISNPGSLYACRLLIRFFEAAIFLCIDVYSKRGTCSAIIFAFSAFPSAFDGLLAYGLTQINGPNGFSGWRWRYPHIAYCTTKRMVNARYELNPHWGIDDEFSWGAINVLVDLKFYTLLSFIFQFCCDVSLYTVQTFLPAIVKGLGYTSAIANLMTAPVYMLGSFWFLFVAYIHFKRASMVGKALTTANTAGVAVGQIYRTEDTPRYIKGLTISLRFWS
ncbi:high-affinity nicotinic acid transporter [Calycina marina]|uniref:High-affinity nicotinic acid transporter n=1 Tax=Calycina marina TaxID=1763456 RepID=A0A9P8CCM5_9HELO|nr:high-affinity nicotinic acid transporter [Calycina marina]